MLQRRTLADSVARVSYFSRWDPDYREGSPCQRLVRQRLDQGERVVLEARGFSYSFLECKGPCRLGGGHGNAGPTQKKRFISDAVVVRKTHCGETMATKQ